MKPKSKVLLHEGEPSMSIPSRAALIDAPEAPPERRVRYDVRLLADQDIYLFNEGTHYKLYDHLGAHETSADGVRGTAFAVWAPNAERVTVMGDFNGWNNASHDLRPRASSGIWQGFVPGLGPGAAYKYHIYSRYLGYQVDKADPLAFFGEVPPKTASVVWNLDYPWTDQEWMANRRRHNSLSSPLSIYAVHLGSLMRVPGGGHRPLT